MARLTRPEEKRTRITFYLGEKDAARLDQLKEKATQMGLTISFREDFGKWFRTQLDQLEKDLKKLVKEGGIQNG